MSIVLSKNVSGEIEMLMIGSHNNGAEIQRFTEKRKMHMTPITMLYLHVLSKNQSIFEKYLEKFIKHFIDPTHKNESGLDYIKNMILEDCGKNDVHKVCPTCDKEYVEKKREFEDVFLIPKEMSKCDEHV